MSLKIRNVQIFEHRAVKQDLEKTLFTGLCPV